MILSMTGFGHGECEKNQKRISIDIKSVNGKFLDTSIKMSRQFLSLEDMTKKTISSHITRGSVEVFINFFDNSSSKEDVIVDKELAQKINDQASLLASELFLDNNMTVKDLMRFPDVVSVEKTDIDIDEVKDILMEALDLALVKFDEMRVREGKALEIDLLSNIKNIENNMIKIEKLAPMVPKEYAEKLKTRIGEALGSIPVDENRLAQEIALFVDKADINEEIVRMKSHINQFRQITDSKEPSGKQYEFLAQEMTRETNTIGSKANNIDITSCVLYQKNELEKIKEQIRNVE